MITGIVMWILMFYRELPSTATTSKVAVCAKLTYKCLVSYRVSRQIMHTVLFLFTTEPDSIFFSNRWFTLHKISFYYNKMLNLVTSTHHPLLMSDKILLQVRSGALCISIGLGIAPYLALCMLIGTLFINRFICYIFLLKQKTKIWPSHPVFVSALLKTSTSLNPAIGSVSSPLYNAPKISRVVKRRSIPIQTQHQVCCRPDT